MTLKSAGVTVARVYCTHETREAFQRMFTALWDTTGRVTGKPVKFKFIHGAGLRAILVDGCKPQIDGCGDDLVMRNNPELSGIYEKDPQVIVQYIVRTCTVHLNRCVFRAEILFLTNI
jgi:hypothetical protein